MRAIAARIGFTNPAFVDVADVDMPGAGELLCRTLQLGVCGTDRDILESARPVTPPGTDHLVLGHECLARVEAVGAGVDGFQAGDLVVPVVRRAREKGVCRVDMAPFGTYTERGIFFEHGFSAPRWLDRPEYLFPVPPRIESVAVLTEPLSVAEKGVNEALAVQRGRLGRQAWAGPPPRVLVTGLGPIGLAAVLACRCRDWPVAVFGRDRTDSFRAQLVVSLGADYVPAAQFSHEPADVERDGYDLILECTGNDEVMLHVAGALASCGVMVWLGSSRHPKAKNHDLERLMRSGVLRNHVHIGCVNAAPRDFTDAIQHLARMFQAHRREVESLVTARVSPSESLWHFQHRQPQGIKTVVMYD